jgi:hypothetical protein
LRCKALECPAGFSSVYQEYFSYPVGASRTPTFYLWVHSPTFLRSLAFPSWWCPPY